MADFFEQESEEEFITTNVLDDVLGEYEGGRNALDERHGYGRALLPNGDRYEGEYKNGKRHGKGEYKFTNARYVGEYHDGKRNGQGVMYYPDGSRYEGNFLNGYRSGGGKYFYINGDTYEGGWVLDQRDGPGVYTYADTGSRFKGNWVDGKRHGPCKWVHKNYSYEGSFVDSIPVGRGKFSFSHGSEQHGVYMMKDIVQQVDKRMELIGRLPVWTCSHLLPKPRGKP